MRISRWILKAEIHTQNMYHLLLFHRKNGYTKAPHC